MSFLSRPGKSGRLSRTLRLGGYVAFNLPRTVTALGGLLLIGLAVTQLYVLTRQTAPPTYFAVYSYLMIGCCLVAAAMMWLGPNPVFPRLGWLLACLVSAVFLGAYLASRAASLPALVAVTGRWDFAPGTFGLAFALGFIGVHISVLLGINVAYPHRQHWHD